MVIIMKQDKTIAAGEFKAKCLQLMNLVRDTHQSIVITKHNVPIAKLTPVNEEPDVDVFGCMKNTVAIKDDIINPIDTHWEVVDE